MSLEYNTKTCQTDNQLFVSSDKFSKISTKGYNIVFKSFKSGTCVKFHKLQININQARQIDTSF